VESGQIESALMESYQEWSDKGQVIDGRRITILTGNLSYQVNEEVRIAHVMEATLPGHEVYVMGPKEVFGEYINGVLQGEALPDDQSDPFSPLEYDGRVLDSPATDFNYDVSVYSFVAPGAYEICWKPGKWISNTLKIEVME
jgi:hypothetical protein